MAQSLGERSLRKKTIPKCIFVFCHTVLKFGCAVYALKKYQKIVMTELMVLPNWKYQGRNKIMNYS